MSYKQLPSKNTSAAVCQPISCWREHNRKSSGVQRAGQVQVCGLTAVVDRVGDDGFERSGESSVAVLQEGGEL